MDPRTDLNSISGSGTSLHHVRASGSYYLSSNIQCGAGRTAISIDPAASSVVIDFNGFVVQGTPGGSAQAGIDCPAAATSRSSLSLIGPRVLMFGGDGISVESVDHLDISSALVSQCGGDGISMRHVRRDGAILAGDFDRCVTGIHALDVPSLRLRDIDVSSCDVGIQACAGALQLEGASVQGCTSDGILLEDSCSTAGTISPPRLAQLNQVVVQDSGDDGIELRATGMSTMQLSATDLMVANCAGHGLHLPLVPAGAPGVGPPAVMLRDATLDACGGSGVLVEGLTSSARGGQHHYVNLRCSGNGQDGISIGSGASLEGESISAEGNGLCGIEVTYGMGVPPAQADELHLSGVHCTNNGLDGCRMDASALHYYGKASLQDFHFVGNGRDGWSVTNISCQALHGTFKSNVRDGVHAEDSDVDLSSTGIADNGGDGVSLLRVRHKGWDGMIYGNHRSGVEATDSYVQIRNVQIYENVEDGVRLTGSDYEQSKGTLRACGMNGLSATDSRVVLDGAFVSSNVLDGLHLVDSTTSCSALQVLDNGGDGIDAFANPAGPAVPITFGTGTLAGNGGQGLAAHGKSSPKLMEAVCKRNAAGGVSSTSGGSCSPVLVHISDCTFDENGGTALDLQNARGGLVERITILASVTGIHVGDPSGTGCTGGVRISDCSVSQCSTGFSVDAGGGHLVVRNFASQCSLAPFDVGAGNLFGPLVATQAEMLATTNPNANFAQ